MITASSAKSSITFRKTLPVVAVCLMLSALSGCGNEAKKPEPAKEKAAGKATPVKIETVKAAPLQQTIELTGTVEAGRIAQLASPAEGPVLHVRVREGDTVRRGQLLVSIGRTEGATALVSSLKEDLKKEDDNLERTRQLVKSGAIPAEQLDAAVANSARMKAQLIKAQESTRDYKVNAPWAGVVSKTKVREGDFLAPRAPLIEIYDPASLVVQLSLPEQHAASVAGGMKAQVELDAYPGKRFSGTVTRLYPYLDPRTRTRIAEISLRDAPRLLPGMFARIFLIQKTIPDAITVPPNSLIILPGGGAALFVAKEGKAERRLVEKGIEQGGRVQIVKGLQNGEKLIVGGHERLKDGAAVKGPEKKESSATPDKAKTPAGGEKP